MKICVHGAGAWGTALAVNAADRHEVTLWARDAAQAAAISAARENIRYLPGLALPGKWSGTFHREGERAFWNVSTPGETIVIELIDEHFTRLVLTVDNPQEVVDAVNAAVRT